MVHPSPRTCSYRVRISPVAVTPAIERVQGHHFFDGGPLSCETGWNCTACHQIWHLGFLCPSIRRSCRARPLRAVCFFLSACQIKNKPSHWGAGCSVTVQMGVLSGNIEGLLWGCCGKTIVATEPYGTGWILRKSRRVRCSWHNVSNRSKWKDIAAILIVGRANDCRSWTRTSSAHAHVAQDES